MKKLNSMANLFWWKKSLRGLQKSDEKTYFKKLCGDFKTFLHRNKHVLTPFPTNLLKYPVYLVLHSIRQL